MDKLITLSDRFSTGEPTVLVVGRWGNNSRFFVEKTASEEPYAFLKSITPDPNFTYVLVNALGAFETYDDNKNGDGFPLLPYNVGMKATCGHKECEESLNGWVSEPETLGHHYKTFEEHGGIYRHHQNKDKSKSLGTIDHAFLNERMKRVELLLKINRKKDSELIDKLDADEYLAVSMGCHVKWDVCTICGHRAPTRAYYCEHAKYSLRQIDPKTGKKVAVLNPSPKFFDISFVFRPADPTGYMLKKVAHVYELHSSAKLGEQLQQNKIKLADVKKVSDIKKIIEGNTVATINTDKDLNIIKKYVDNKLVNKNKNLDDKKIEKLSQYPLSSIIQAHPTISTLDIAKIYHYKQAKCLPNKNYLQKVAELTPIIFELAAKYASIEEMLGFMLKTSDFSDVLKNKILQHTEYQTPNTDLIENPHSVTTQGQMQLQDIANTKSDVLGAALLSAGAYGLLHKKTNLPNWAKIPTALIMGNTLWGSTPAASNVATVKLNEYIDKIATDINNYNYLVRTPSINKEALLKTASDLEKVSLTEIGLVELDPSIAVNVLVNALN